MSGAASVLECDVAEWVAIRTGRSQYQMQSSLCAHQIMPNLERGVSTLMAETHALSRWRYARRSLVMPIRYLCVG